MSNSQRAKLHRDRKKQYYTEIENEVQQLRDQVRQLNQENETLKHSLSNMKQCRCNEEIKEEKLIGNSEENQYKEVADISKDLQSLLDEEKFAYEEIPKMLRNNPEKVRYTLIDHTKEVMGTYGSARIKLLKTAFRTIIEHIVSLESKLGIVTLDAIPFSKLVRTMQTRK